MVFLTFVVYHFCVLKVLVAVPVTSTTFEKGVVPISQVQLRIIKKSTPVFFFPFRVYDPCVFLNFQSRHSSLDSDPVDSTNGLNF